MGAPDFVIRGRRVLAAGELGPRSVHVAGGAIAAVAGFDEVPDGCPIDEAGDAVVMPGVVDTHVHVNEPGRSAWEGYETATRAAAAGGVTTLVDMPLNSIPATVTAQAFRDKLAVAKGQCWIDVGFWGGVIPGNRAELEPLTDAGVLGFKCFLVPSGVDEFPHVGQAELRPALAVLRDLGRPLLVHAEVPDPIEQAAAAFGVADPRAYASYLASRPRAAEDRAIELMIRLSRDTGAAVHIVHHASADSLSMISAARDEGLFVSAETCPHYLHFAAEDIPDGATQYKCAPPIREQENRERLWEALNDGVLDMVVSDHSPCTPDLKQLDAGSFRDAWGGIASLQLGLPVMWTELHRRGRPIERLGEWMSGAPAALAGLRHRKGEIAPGYDADIVVWDPEASFVVKVDELHHRNAVSPYDGETLSGVVRTTYVRGRKVYDAGAHVGTARGELLVPS